MTSISRNWQDYIEAENNRLEAEQQFWSREIVVRIEYKHCPNLTIIDTPGMTGSVAESATENSIYWYCLVHVACTCCNIDMS